MTEEQLLKAINYDDEHQSEVGIPNYLFTDLINLSTSKKLKPQHIGFAYSYIYFITYMTRYAKYDKFVPSVKMIKKLFGYREDNKTLDYIIKENGLLDSEGITVVIDDFPVIAMWEDEGGLEKELTFTYASELWDGVEDFKKQMKIHPNTRCKLPMFGFYQNAEDWDSGEPYDGTFFYSYDDSEISFTLIDFKVFAYCIANPEELGCNAFYLYSYLKHKNDIFSGYNATSERLANETGFSKFTVEKYRNNMRSYHMMTLHHEMEYFVVGLTDEIERKASNNIIHTYNNFTDRKVEYIKQQKIGLKTLSKLQSVADDIDELFG